MLPHPYSQKKKIGSEIQRKIREGMAAGAAADEAAAVEATAVEATAVAVAAAKNQNKREQKGAPMRSCTIVSSSVFNCI